jgi:hypothetical protein
MGALPACLLVAVAAAQIAAARCGPISPWVGGGFGMFATLDSPARRHVHATALRTGLREEVEIPPELDREVRRAVSLPTAHRLRVLARALEAFVRDTDDPGAASLEAIAVTVYRVRYDRASLAPSGEPIAWLTVETARE